MISRNGVSLSRQFIAVRWCPVKIRQATKSLMKQRWAPFSHLDHLSFKHFFTDYRCSWANSSNERNSWRRASCYERKKSSFLPAARIDSLLLVRKFLQFDVDIFNFSKTFQQIGDCSRRFTKQASRSSFPCLEWAWYVGKSRVRIRRRKLTVFDVCITYS